MEVVVHARILCFNKSFKRNCIISTGIPNFGVWCKNDSIGLPDSKSDKKIRPLVLLGIRLQLHPKSPTPCDSDTNLASYSATLLRTPCFGASYPQGVLVTPRGACTPKGCLYPQGMLVPPKGCLYPQGVLVTPVKNHRSILKLQPSLLVDQSSTISFPDDHSAVQPAAVS